MAITKETRLQMRSSPDLERRIAQLMKKKGLDKSGVVNVAVAEMHEREFPEKNGKNGNAS